MVARSAGARILIYSHDTFGLGHLRRCRAIAHALVELDPSISVLILTGSPIIGSFDFRARVDFVRIPGVIKLRNGDYTSLNLSIDIEETVRMRESIIQHTAEIFAPDIMIVDKEPLGLRGEVEDTLRMLKRRGTRLVLGLRDILDDPSQLIPEWERKRAIPALEELYDDIWIYGLEQIHDPLAGLDLPESVKAKVTFTGYLPRPLSEKRLPEYRPEISSGPYLLVTPGGGGDGEGLIDWVLSAYETEPDMPLPAMLVLGPFMQSERQVEFQDRAGGLANVEAIVFDAHMEQLESRAAGIVAMGGYNTFCEILTHDKPALIVPRTVPRLEQYIRARQAQELGLLRMLVDPSETGGAPRDPKVMAEALRHLPDQKRPSDVIIPGLLAGFERLSEIVGPWIADERRWRTGGGTSSRTAVSALGVAAEDATSDVAARVIAMRAKDL